MLKLVLLPCLFLLTILAQGEKINAVSLKSGCRLIKVPSTYFTSSAHNLQTDDWTWQGLIDENPSVGWCSGAASKAPYTFVFELSEDYLIDSITFNNICQTESKGICSKDIHLEYSVTSASAGFISIDTFTLKAYSLVKNGIKSFKSRWLRLTILSNYGNPQWTELMEFEAWGTLVQPVAERVIFNGVWKKTNEILTISQSKNGNLYGCYSWAQREFYITYFKRNTYSFNWTQKTDSLSGWGLFILNKEGTFLSAIWGLDGDSITFGNDIFTKTAIITSACPNDKASEAIAPKSSKPDRKNNGVTVLIEVLDEDSREHITGTIDIYTVQQNISVPSSDGYYSTELPLAPFVVKIIIPDYFPRTDTIRITEEFSRGYVSRTIHLSKLRVGNNIILKDILFNKGSSELLPNSNAELEALLYTLKKYPNMEIELSGHTDNQGNEDKNVLLSEQRVMSVKDYLVHNGINPKRIDGIGYGGKYPIANNATEQSRRLNRRVELKIIRM
jgi:outer membrane protein OmpA-like peptidoglycan-associated protein